MQLSLIQNIFDVCRGKKSITFQKNPKYKSTKMLQSTQEAMDYCPICKNNSVFLPCGVSPRPHAQCPHCGSLERHRHFFPTYQNIFLENTQNIKLLHTAPEKCIASSIMEAKHIEYYPIDLFPHRYNWLPCGRGDVTDLCFKDDFFDVIISNHVMEHIIDDEKFMSEMLRVLKTGGILLLNFPIFMDLQETFHDPNIVSPEDREKYYGQDDHVRKYGSDIIEKLKNKYNAEYTQFENNDILFLIKKGAN